MQIKFFEWDDHNIEHIARHQIFPEEVEQACIQDPFIRRGRNARHLIYGRTFAGRYLMIVCHYRGRGLVYPITARNMTWIEQRLYQEHR